MTAFEGATSGLRLGRRLLSGTMAITIPSGQIHLLSGANGCGKSLFLDAAVGVGPAGGVRTYLGTKDLTGSSPSSRWRLGLRRMFQAPIVPGDATVEAAMAHCGYLEEDSGGLGSEAWRFLGAAAVLPSKQVYQLSFGQRRAVELCMSLRTAGAVLLDEPFSGMAYGLLPRAATLVRRAAEAGAAVLVVDHLKNSETLEYDREHAWVNPPEALGPLGEGLEPPDALADCARHWTGRGRVRWEVQTLKVATRIVAESLTISLDSGRVVLVEGGNGSGKSTILRTLAGVPQPWNGVETEIVRSWREPDFLLSPQPPKLLADLTVSDNLRYMLLPPRGLVGDRLTVAREVLRWMGLQVDRCWNRWARDLSGGEAAMVALVGAVVSDKPVLFLDEPFEGLSSAARDRASRLLARALELGKCAILTTHDAGLLSRAREGAGIRLDGRTPASGDYSGVPFGALFPAIGETQ